MTRKEIKSLNEDGKKVVEEINENGEISKITTEGDQECLSEQTVEIFEDRKILAKRVTEYVKPIVYKIKTEVLNECGEVVDVIVEELDEGTLNMQSHSLKTSKQAPASQSCHDSQEEEEAYFSSQSVSSPKTIMPSTAVEPQYRFHAVSYKDMASRSRRLNRHYFSSQSHEGGCQH